MLFCLYYHGSYILLVPGSDYCTAKAYLVMYSALAELAVEG